MLEITEYFAEYENRGVVGTQVCPNHIHDRSTRREGVLELNLEALFTFILLESKDLFIYFVFLKKEKIEDWKKIRVTSRQCLFMVKSSTMGVSS